MASPFPGMNPYLERESVWHDFHQRAVTAIADALSAQIGPDLITRVDDHVYVHELPPETRTFLGRPDVALSESRPANGGPTTALLAAPAEVGLPEMDEEHLSFVEIRDRDDWHVVCVVELLSPSNKSPGKDRNQYLAKRRSILASDAHFIEIDLLRGGPRLPLYDLPACDYYAMVSRVERRPKAEIWPVRVRERLPSIPVPLTVGRADVELDLQALLERVYDAARYRNYIYMGEPEPPLPADDAHWAGLLAARRE